MAAATAGSYSSSSISRHHRAAAGKHTTRRCTNLGGQVAPEVLAHRRLDLEDGLVRRRPEVYPAVVQPGVGGHGRRLSPANQTHSKHDRHDEDCRLRGDRGTMRGARGRARKGEGVDANSRGGPWWWNRKFAKTSRSSVLSNRYTLPAVEQPIKL